MTSSTTDVRRAGPGDAGLLARFLHDFNTEFSEPTPPVEALEERLDELLASEEIAALLVGEPPLGMAIVRYRPSLWSKALDAYLEELYVVPDKRGQGSGRALMEKTLETVREAGAEHIELCTGETDREARGLYESLGFTNREGGPDGPTMLYYELDL
jgi:ribosomal protein S18 acetylase RimI-like enzyme